MSSSGPTIQETEGDDFSRSVLYAADQSKVIGLVLPITVTVVTSFRLFEWARQARLWLDGAWAALAMILNIIFLIVNWLYLHDYGNGVISPARATFSYYPRAQYPQHTRVVIYYLVAQIFYTVVCIHRRRVYGDMDDSLCASLLDMNIAIAQIITDVFRDMILILAPFHLIYKVRLSRAQKIRVLSIFSTDAITTIVSLSHAYYVVANLSVVVAFLLFRISTEETPTPAPLELKSIITFGSQPALRKREPLVTRVIGVETTTIKMDDFTTPPQASDWKRQRRHRGCIPSRSNDR
ncbi:hypothetical protein EV363DRAFT_1445685 [Boletus edulis]|nr:hypothetical protein EV363DRAFT_1445685 [Boletus edulis]